MRQRSTCQELICKYDLTEKKVQEIWTREWGKLVPRLHHWDSQLLKQTGLKSTGLQMSPMKCFLELGENTDLWSLAPHWFKMMLQELSLLNVQVAHVWGPTGFPQQQPGILAAGSKSYPYRPKSQEILSGLICTKLVKAKCSGAVSVPVGGTASVWSNVQELYKMCLLCTHFFFFVKMVTPLFLT